MFASGLGTFEREDASVVLGQRAVSGVSLDPASSLLALHNECQSQPRTCNTPVAQLSLFYSWLGRVYANFGHANVFDEIFIHKTTSTSSNLPCGPLNAFVSADRKRALDMCGWSDLCSPAIDTHVARACNLEALSTAIPVPVVQQCLRDGDVERAAAIALLHGLVEVSVQILTFAADDARREVSGGRTLEAELLQLTAMALAGWWV